MILFRITVTKLPLFRGRPISPLFWLCPFKHFLLPILFFIFSLFISQFTPFLNNFKMYQMRTTSEDYLYDYLYENSPNNFTKIGRYIFETVSLLCFLSRRIYLNSFICYGQRTYNTWRPHFKLLKSQFDHNIF